ncbi:hypothetical protein B0H11DRAFT_755416 [Mycena galericulata]|nr:hypothetical protein B0H11DRAFT_755416 [Mycena galericulata]
MMQIFKFLVLTLASTFYTRVAATAVIKDIDLAMRQVVSDSHLPLTSSRMAHSLFRPSVNVLSALFPLPTPLTIELVCLLHGIFPMTQYITSRSFLSTFKILGHLYGTYTV